AGAGTVRWRGRPEAGGLSWQWRRSCRFRLTAGLAAGGLPGLAAAEQFASELVACFVAGLEAVEDAVDVAAGVLAGGQPGVVAEGESCLVAAGQVCLASLLVGGGPQLLVVLVAVPDHLGERVEGLAAHRNVLAVVAAHR